jgi:hypothetical protein
MTKRWDEIRKAADAAGFYHGWMMAEENAVDTLGCDHGEEFERLALASLQSLLADASSISCAERQFFVRIGIEF